MKRFFFTFMQKQATKSCYVEIRAVDEIAARNEMVKQYGTQWAFCYDEKGFEGQVEQFGLQKIAEITV